MVTKPMAGDGPAVRDPFSDDVLSVAEMLASTDDCSELLGALSYSRAWTDDVPLSSLSPWQQVGPEILWAVARQTEAELHKIGPVVTGYVENLSWVRKMRLSQLQVELAVYDAFCRVAFGDCTSSDVSAMMVACRKQTFLDLRAEAVAFMVFAMGMAECRVRAQLFGNSDTP